MGFIGDGEPAVDLLERPRARSRRKVLSAVARTLGEVVEPDVGRGDRLFAAGPCERFEVRTEVREYALRSAPSLPSSESKSRGM